MIKLLVIFNERAKLMLKILLPITPLIIIGLNFRYSVLSNVIINITKKIADNNINFESKEIFIEELQNFKQRIELIKYSIITCFLAFALNIIAICFIYYDLHFAENLFFCLSIIPLSIGLAVFIFENSFH